MAQAVNLASVLSVLEMNHAEVGSDVVLGDESGGADRTALLFLVHRVHVPLEGLLGVQLGVAGHALGGGGALRAGQVLHLVVDAPDVDVQVGLDHKGLATERAHVAGRGRRVTVSFMAKDTSGSISFQSGKWSSMFFPTLANLTEIKDWQVAP